MHIFTAANCFHLQHTAFLVTRNEYINYFENHNISNIT